MQAIKPFKIRHTIFLIYFICFVVNAAETSAQTIIETNSSSEVSVDTNTETVGNSELRSAQILLTEVNFNNSEEDFLKFKVFTSKSSLNLKGLEFYDDKIFKTIDNDFLVHDKDEITLYFNLTQSDNSSAKELFTERVGLTATTEQIILKQGDFYFDFFCWQKAPISKSELSDFQKIFQSDFWNSSEINSCIDSSKIATNQSLFHLNEKHLSEAWTTESTVIANSADEQKSDSDENDADSQSDIDEYEQYSEQTEEVSDVPRTLKPATYSPETTKKKTASKKSSSSASGLAIELASIGTDQIPEEQNIIISEIMPAPAKAKDSKEKVEEWIEVFNQSEQDIDLKGWIIDDSDGGSKPHILESQILPAQGFLVLKATETKLSLNNSTDQIRVFDAEKNLVDAVEYQEAEKNSSYARITIDEQTEWSWQKISSPGEANPLFISITGTIISNPLFEEIYHFQIQSSDNDIYEIQFDEATVKAPLAKNIFTVGTTGKFIGQIIDSDSTVKLNQYQLDETAVADNNNSLPIIIIVTMAAAGTAIYFLIKNKKWISGLSGKSQSLS